MTIIVVFIWFVVLAVIFPASMVGLVWSITHKDWKVGRVEENTIHSPVSPDLLAEAHQHALWMAGKCKIGAWGMKARYARLAKKFGKKAFGSSCFATESFPSAVAIRGGERHAAVGYATEQGSNGYFYTCVIYFD